MKLPFKIITSLFVVFWTAFIFLDYWQKHPVYYFSFTYFDYWGFAFALLILGAATTWAVLKFGKDKKRKSWFNGLTASLLFLLVSVMSVGAVHGKLVPNASFDFPRIMHVLVLVGGTALAVYFITCACFVLGGFIHDFLKVEIGEEDAGLVSVATGLMGLVLFCFLLGAVSLLHAFVLFPCLAVLFFFGRKKAIAFLKTTLLQPLAPDRQLNWLGAAGFFALLVLFSLNFTAVNVPMPPGFDALTLYANLPSLIGQRHALIEGFQPYNWSILMSLGHVLFGSTEISLALSNFGGILSAFALFALCRNWLKMDVNFSLLAVLVFSLTPAITIQSFGELKVDLGLLFICMAALLVFLNYLKNAFEERKQTKPAAVKNNPPLIEPNVALAGLLTGFGLGVKLTTAYFAFALVCALWLAFSGKRGFLAAFLFCLFLVFLLKLDDFGGLRQYHLGVNILQWGVLLASGLLLAGTFLDDREKFKTGAARTVLYGAFAVLPFLPWVAKNYLETRSLSPTQLLNGKQASPEVNLNTLEQNLQLHGK